MSVFIYSVLYATFQKAPTSAQLHSVLETAKTTRDVVESKTVYRKNVYTFHVKCHLNMYILISSLTTSMTLPKCVEQIVSNSNLPWPLVRVSLGGVCKCVGSCLVYCNVHVQTC